MRPICSPKRRRCLEGHVRHADDTVLTCQHAALVDEGVFTLETIVEKMCHAPAQIYRINERGYIREGYRADLVLVRPDTPWEVTADKVLSKCGWSPLEGHTFNWKVERTFANGHPVYSDGMVDDAYRGEELRFGE